MGGFSSWWRRWGRLWGGLEVPRAELRRLQRLLGYRFRDPRVLVQALKHRSYVYARQERGLDSNERLEFLGDAVLDLIVADFHSYFVGNARVLSHDNTIAPPTESVVPGFQD